MLFFYWSITNHTRIVCVCHFNPKWTIFQLYHDKNYLHVDEMIMIDAVRFVLDQHA